MQLIETAEVEAIAAVHSHIREGEVVGPLIEQEIEGGADVIGPMPNTDKGLTTAKDVVRYIDEAKSLVPAGKVLHFVPIVMITELTTREAEFAFLPLALMFLQETKATIIWEHGTDARCIPFWEELAKETGRFFV